MQHEDTVFQTFLSRQLHYVPILTGLVCEINPASAICNMPSALRTQETAACNVMFRGSYLSELLTSRDKHDFFGVEVYILAQVEEFPLLNWRF